LEMISKTIIMLFFVFYTRLPLAIAGERFA